MFSPDMSRALVLFSAILVLVAGCATQEPVVIVPAAPEIKQYPSVEQWLGLQHDVEHLSEEEAVARLIDVGEPQGNGQMFYYGLLNQQLSSYGSWTNARDAFQKVQENEALPFEPRQLAGILRKYNQNRINWYLRQKDLLVASEAQKHSTAALKEENTLLQQKIDALTELEAVISTRREQ